MEIKTNKVYYGVKNIKSAEDYNYRRIFEFSSLEKAEKYFDNLYQIYDEAMSVEERSNTTVFLVKILDNDEEVLAYFGMGLRFFNGAPMWVSRSYSKGVI